MIKPSWVHKFNHKKIVLLGFGLEGKSTLRCLLLYAQGTKIQIMDQNPDYVKVYLREAGLEIEVIDQEHYLVFDQDVDIVFKSPGIPYKQIEGHLGTLELTSQTNEFIQAYRSQIIGITGTKGKSTTCTFLYQLLNALGANVELVGNIGKPAFDYIGMEDVDYFVYELSSHQLETVHVSPHIGVLLNVFEEHLDHYHSYHHYVSAKLNIGLYQQEEDLFITGAEVRSIQSSLNDFKGSVVWVGQDEMMEGVVITDEQIKIRHKERFMDIPVDEERVLLGQHNLINMCVGIYISMVLGYDNPRVVLDLVKTFKGIPHRLAFVREVNGVRYYNDSISTIPQATIAAIEAIPFVGVVILGGMDRGIAYQLLIDYLNDHEDLRVVLLPDSGHRLFDKIHKQDRCKVVDHLREAVMVSSDICLPGEACLLSPAAASYGFFKNFEDRGSQFEALVHQISETNVS